MKLPDRKNIFATNLEDPLKYYYLPILGSLFRKRLEVGLRLLGTGKFSRILEIGYGSGILFPELQRRSSLIVGVDTHHHPELVREMMRREGIDAVLGIGDILHLSFIDGSFDALVCLSVLEHVADLEQALD